MSTVLVLVRRPRYSLLVVADLRLQIGVNLAHETSEANIEEFDKMLNVHVRGSFLILRSISAIMKDQQPVAVDEWSSARGTTRGSIVMIGSASAFAATPRMIQYTGSKHAVAGLVKNAGKSL